MSERILFALAGLLHDIGKFGQRADGKYYSSEELTAQSKDIADKICPKSRTGFYTHQHVIWTNNFLEKFRQKFIDANLYGQGENNMFNLACYHHSPSTLEQAIITMADHWSSGVDRNTLMVADRVESEGRFKFKTQPIVSIFNEIATVNKPNGIGKGIFGHNVTVLNTSDQIFPEKISNLSIAASYHALYKEFENQFSRLDVSSTKGFIETAYNLIQLYTSYIPASTMDYPDSSLFEHMKITGAFSDCLASYYHDYPDAFIYDKGSKLKLDQKHYPVLMVCGDISGIQAFIYNISNKSALKGLKGRSFYIQIMAEAYLRKIVYETGGSHINSIYSAGGKFYLLLPNTKGTVEKIEEIKKDVQLSLWKEHGGKLNLNIGYIPFKLENVSGQLKVFSPEISGHFEIGELWRFLSEKTADSKRKRYDYIIENHFEELFNSSGYGGNAAKCSVTGEELNENGYQLDVQDVEQGDDNNNIVSAGVMDQIRIGSLLYQSDYLIKYSSDRDEGFSIPSAGIWDLKLRTDHFHSIESVIKIAFQGNGPDLDFLPTIEKAAGKSFKYYGGSKMVQFSNKNATLEELCKGTDGKSEKLGVLRMDVDSLGQIFMHGFSKESASFSKLSWMSSQLDLFFSGYVNTILKKDEYTSHVNIVYAGGDDLFAVGRWDKLIDLSIEIRNDFKKFVCDRDDITLSAGIVIVNPKFPIAKAASDAEYAEKMAKDHSFTGMEKNSLNVFGISLNWKEEIPFVIEFKNKLVQWIEKDQLISKGLLMKIFDYYQMYQNGNIEWRWQSAYTMSRYQKTARGSESKNAIEIIKTLLFTGNFNNKISNIRFEAIIASCRWAELLIKK